MALVASGLAKTLDADLHVLSVEFRRSLWRGRHHAQGQVARWIPGPDKINPARAFAGRVTGSGLFQPAQLPMAGLIYEDARSARFRSGYVVGNRDQRLCNGTAYRDRGPASRLSQI